MIETKEKIEARSARAKRWRNLWEVRTAYVAADNGHAFEPGDLYLSAYDYPSAEIAEQRALDDMRTPQFPPHLGALDDLYRGPVEMDGGQCG